MTACQARLVPAHLADDGMLPCTEDTLGIRVRQATLVVRVLAHKVHRWKIQLLRARGAAGDLEYLGLGGVGQRGDLCGLGGGFGAVGLDEGFILRSTSQLGRVHQCGQGLTNRLHILPRLCHFLPQPLFDIAHARDTVPAEQLNDRERRHDVLFVDLAKYAA